MCNPAAFMIAGAALSAKGQYDQGQADADTLDAEASAERLKAWDARVRGSQEAGRIRQETTQAVGTARAQLSTTDLDITSGSPLEAQLDVRMVGETDVLTRQNNAWREAWGHEQQALAYEKAAKKKRQYSWLGPLGSFVGGASSAYSSGSSRNS